MWGRGSAAASLPHTHNSQIPPPRRLTPNFKIRAEVQFQDRCSFPLTLKAYIIGQGEKDTLQEWVPEDFLDPDAPPVSSWRRDLGS